MTFIACFGHILEPYQSASSKAWKPRFLGVLRQSSFVAMTLVWSASSFAAREIENWSIFIKQGQD